MPRDRPDLDAIDLPLVPQVARQYLRRWAYRLPGGLTLDDLIQEGCLAVLRCRRHYDPARAASYKAYVIQALHRACRRALERHRLPVRVGAPTLRQASSQGRAGSAPRTRETLERAGRLLEGRRVDLTETAGALDPGLEAVDVADELAWALGQLPERHRRAVELRHGLGGRPLMTNEEAAASGLLGLVRRSCVQYLYDQALIRLRQLLDPEAA